ncbi:MAG: hypothetical protein QM648_06540 [Solirubrobacterales bacterium]
MRNLKAVSAIAAAVIAAGAISGCGEKKGEDASTGAPGATTSISVTDAVGALPLMTKKSKDGVILASIGGRTVYSYDTEGDKAPSCTGECAWTWLPVISAGGVSITKQLDASKVGAVTRGEGKKQVTYGGHPLYYYARDGGATPVTGNGKVDFDITWRTITPEGEFTQSK